jgi:hypothetical protein
MMPQYTKDNISQALINVANGKGVRAAARDWGLPYITLRERIKGHETIAFQQKISKDYQGFKKAT